MVKGPRGHKYPHDGKPGPAIGFLQEAVRWWDTWLKDIDTGIMDEPMLRVWMQDSVPPTTSYDCRPGRWVAESSWPSPKIKQKEYLLGSNRVLLNVGEETGSECCKLQSPLGTGLFAGKWCSYTSAPDMPYDQRIIVIEAASCRSTSAGIWFARKRPDMNKYINS